LAIQGIDDAIVRALKARAARNGRSVAAEHREILRAALLSEPPMSFKEFLLSMPDPGPLKRSRSKPRRVRL